MDKILDSDVGDEYGLSKNIHVFRNAGLTMERKNNKEFAHISGLINELMATYKRSLPDSEMTRIFGLWYSAIGENIAANTRPTAFKGSLLFVNVVSSPWMHQLRYLKKDMIHNINTALGKELVKDIKFKIGPV